MLYNMQIFIF